MQSSAKKKSIWASVVKPSESITYLGLPIGRSLHSTGMLLVRHVEVKIRIAYGSIIGNRHRFCRKYLASLYNAIALPHVLYIAPFWKYLSSAQCAKVRVLFFRFAKFLLRLPPWTSNSYIMRNYGVSDPTVCVNRVAENFLKNAKGRANPLLAILCQ